MTEPLIRMRGVGVSLAIDRQAAVGAHHRHQHVVDLATLKRIERALAQTMKQVPGVVDHRLQYNVGIGEPYRRHELRQPTYGDHLRRAKAEASGEVPGFAKRMFDFLIEVQNALDMADYASPLRGQYEVAGTPLKDFAGKKGLAFLHSLGNGRLRYVDPGKRTLPHSTL
ncbi:MAG TPA: hypothetical protein VGN93_11250 [Shinella sp.]|jgi:hypothetical protein|nr:hypothetical protein [Shinella sp.]